MYTDPGRARQLRRAVLLVGWFALLCAAGAGAAPGLPGELSAKARAHGSVRVIVELAVDVQPEGTLSGPAAVAAQRAAIESESARVLAGIEGLSHQVSRQFRTIPFLALDLSPAALEALEREGRVVSWQEDVAERPILAESGPQVQAPGAFAAGLDGSGQLVAVLDTGVEAGHPMLAGKLAAEACFSAGRDCPNGQNTQFGTGAGAFCAYAPQDCDHGTHVSGIAVGDGPGLDGIARGAGLVSIQVFSEFKGALNCGIGNSPCALSYVSDVLMALEHVLLLQASLPIAAANLSLGGTVYSAPCDASEAARKAAIDNLRSVGIPTVIASGNNGSSDGIATPACISTAVSVGASTDVATIATFSNSDTFLSLLAPGSSITSSVPGGGMATWNGTSMATPHVAGAWALLRQHLPGVSVSDALAALQATGLPITDTRNGVTKSRIRILDAAAALACFDADDDGVCDADDLCPGFEDALDTDFDGTPDGCDPDDDDDGLLDGVETGTGVFVSPDDTGTDPLLSDTDGDGYGDADELAAGSDPNDPGSTPAPPAASVPLFGSAGSLLAAAGAILAAGLCDRLRRRRAASRAAMPRA